MPSSRGPLAPLQRARPSPPLSILLSRDEPMDISSLIFPKVDLEAVAHAFDGVGHEGRVQTVVELGKREMMALFDAAAESPATTLEDFVPADIEPMTEVIHHGKNSLPAFSRFQKRFCRPEEGAPDDQLWGYNHNTPWLQTLTGPGYFVARPWKDGGIVIDYTMLPPKHPASWPEILPNTARLSRFVYNGMQDVMRKLSEHVTIGRAQRGDKLMDAWFILVREDKPIV